MVMVPSIPSSYSPMLNGVQGRGRDPQAARYHRPRSNNGVRSIFSALLALAASVPWFRNGLY